MVAGYSMIASCIRCPLSRTRLFCLSYANVTRSSGISSHIKQEPWSSRIGTSKLLLILGPCIYFGGLLGKSLAEFLDEWSIFCPGDDEDEE